MPPQNPRPESPAVQRRLLWRDRTALTLMVYNGIGLALVAAVAMVTKDAAATSVVALVVITGRSTFLSIIGLFSTPSDRAWIKNAGELDANADASLVRSGRAKDPPNSEEPGGSVSNTGDH